MYFVTKKPALTFFSLFLLIGTAESGFWHRLSGRRPKWENVGRATFSKKFVIRSGPERKVHLSDADFQRARSNPVADQPLSSDFLVRRDLVEGDIYGHTPESFEQFVNDMNEKFKAQSDDRTIQNSAIRNSQKLWPDGKIPYHISSYYSQNARAKLAEAIADFHARTCIQFVPRYYESDFLYIRPQGGCWSQIGKSGGEQSISLDDRCFQKGTILHELMHAMGFFHEQSRNDRDTYVKIMWQNIAPGTKGNFAKYPLYMIDHLGTSYDYKSVMHYGKDFFSYNSGDTIIPTYDPNAKIGQRLGFSDIDVERINRLYKCSTIAPVTTTPATVATQRPWWYTKATTTARPWWYQRTTTPWYPQTYNCDGCAGCTGCAGCPGCDGCPGCPGCAPCPAVGGHCPACPQCPQCHQCPLRGCQTCPACPACPC